MKYYLGLVVVLRSPDHGRPDGERSRASVGRDLALAVGRGHLLVVRGPGVDLAAAGGRVLEVEAGLAGLVPGQDGLARLDDHGLVDLEVGGALDVGDNLDLLVILGQHGTEAGLDLNINGKRNKLQRL